MRRIEITDGGNTFLASTDEEAIQSAARMNRPVRIRIVEEREEAPQPAFRDEVTPEPSPVESPRREHRRRVGKAE